MSELVTAALRLQTIYERKKKGQNKLITYRDKKKRIKRFHFER